MTARIYVGTYAKYNAGSIAGAWLDLDKYADRDAFLEACGNLHKDETDPELMFQDYEGFPKNFYSESSIPDALWDWLDLDEDDRNLLAAYQDAVDEKGDIDAARDAFFGIHDSERDFADSFLEETHDMDKLPNIVRYNIDLDGVVRDFKCDGWSFHRNDEGVYVFSPN